MPQTKTLMAGLVLATTLAGCGESTADAKPAPTQQSNTESTTTSAPDAAAKPGSAAAPSVLFTQSATSGTFTRAGSGQHTLTLRGVGQQTVWFQDRPGRRAGQQTTTEFVRDWRRQGFEKDAPNAALTLLNGNEKADTVVVELTSTPRYDRARKTISYPARVLDDAPKGMRAFGADRSIPRRFSHASLFIDSGTAPRVAANGAFLRGTSVLMGDGSAKELGSVSVGDQVMSTDDTGAQVPALVEDTRNGTMSYGADSTRVVPSLPIRNGGLIMDSSITFPNGYRSDVLVPGDTLVGVDGPRLVMGRQQRVVISMKAGVPVFAALRVGGPTGTYFVDGLLVQG